MNKLNKMEKELMSVLKNVTKNTKTQTIDELNHSSLMRLNKDVLAKLIVDLAGCLNSNLDICKSAAGTIDDLKSELIFLIDPD